MLFPTFSFLLFFLVVAVVMVALQQHFLAKKTVLVIASYYFYAQWDWHFCFLLAFSSVISYVAGLLISSTENRQRRRLFVGIAVALHLALLGAFKYLDFFVSSANQLATLLGLQHELPFFEILLPVGISFFTFHGISYITDVYRGDVAVCTTRWTCCFTCRFSRSSWRDRLCAPHISCRSWRGLRLSRSRSLRRCC
jgi:alginate O-acetyltransferase complex protein AlgI